MLPRFHYAVEIHSPPKEVWRAFANINRLDGKGTYDGTHWISGEPWHRGSRLAFKMVRPFPITVTSVVSNCEPPYRAELINHCIGLTSTHWVSFDPFGSGTLARIVLEVIGKSVLLPEAQVSKLANELLKDSLEDLRAVCEAAPVS
jgi:hypothetical protein